MNIRGVILNELAPRSQVFTTGEAAAAAQVSDAVASRALARVAREGLVTRIVRGVWAMPKDPRFTPYLAIPYLLRRRPGAQAYVSFLSALHLHGMISQIPGAIHVATGKQRRTVSTPIGTFRFHQLEGQLLSGHEPGDAYGRFELATPTKALFDTLYVSARRGKYFGHLPELEIPRRATDRDMQRWIARIRSRRLRSAVQGRWRRLLDRRTRPKDAG
jgi:predicted transcriptional regulator of viral defense system